VEARTILDVPFDGTSTSLTFKLKYPENSQFVAVVSSDSLFFFLFLSCFFSVVVAFEGDIVGKATELWTRVILKNAPFPMVCTLIAWHNRRLITQEALPCSFSAVSSLLGCN
jgi:hypothetical protein